MINIGIIEDNEKFSLELKEYLNQSKNLCCDFYVSSFEQFEKYYSESLQLQIILVDLKLPGKSGIDCIKYISKLSPKLDTIVLTIYKDTKLILQAITNGASGYLLKSDSFEKVENAIIETSKGGSILSPEISRCILAEFNPALLDKEENSKHDFKPTEVKIINFLRKGKSYDAIAFFLGITQSGVKYHVRNIYKKMNVKSKLELINKLKQMDLFNSRKN